MNNAIEVRNLCKSYPGFALKDISFTVPQGLCCGFVGAKRGRKVYYHEDHGEPGLP